MRQAQGTGKRRMGREASETGAMYREEKGREMSEAGAINREEEKGHGSE